MDEILSNFPRSKTNIHIYLMKTFFTISFPISTTVPYSIQYGETSYHESFRLVSNTFNLVLYIRLTGQQIYIIMYTVRIAYPKEMIVKDSCELIILTKLIEIEDGHYPYASA